MAPPTPPHAPRRPHVLSIHGDERVDDWYWLRERDDPDVIAYLEAENAYADAMLAPLVPLRERIFDEIKTRVALYFARDPDQKPVPAGAPVKATGP